jgi:hypothetical protein
MMLLQRRLGRRGQAVLQVLVALADHLQVQRQHQRAALGHLAALDHAGHGLAVAHHVELEPERRRGVLRDVLDRADAHGRQRERDAELLGRLGRLDLAVGALHAGQAHRRDAHRHLHVLPTILVAVLRFSMFTATRWRSLIFWKSSLLAR